MNHVCEVDECGWSCWMQDGEPTRDISVYFGDAGTVDGEGPCNCEGHDG